MATTTAVSRSHSVSRVAVPEPAPSRRRSSSPGPCTVSALTVPKVDRRIDVQRVPLEARPAGDGLGAHGDLVLANVEERLVKVKVILPSVTGPQVWTLSLGQL